MQNIVFSYFLTIIIYWSSTCNICIYFAAILFVFFVDAVSITNTISSHAVTEVSAILLKYLLFSQIHMLGFQL